MGAHSDGTSFPLSLSLEEVCDAEGRLSFVGTVAPQVEDTDQSIVVYLDNDGKILYCSDMIAMLGHEQAEMNGSNINRLLSDK